MCIRDSSRGIAVIHPGVEGKDLSGFDFMGKALNMKNGYIEYEWQNPGEKEKRMKAGSLVYFQPWDVIIWVSSYKSEFMKFVHLETIQNILSGVKIGEKGYAMIYNSQGKPVLTEGLNERAMNEDGTGPVGSAIKNMIEKARADTSKIYVEEIPFGFKTGQMGVSHIVSYRFINELDWLVVTAISVGESVKFMKTILMVLCILFVAGFVTIALFTGAVISKILGPVSEVKELSEAVSAGDLTRRANITSNDEIGQMSIQFNLIINNFSSVLRDIKETTAVLQDSVQDLSSTSQEISTTSNQQAAAVKEVVSTMEDSDRLSKSISVKIEEVTRVSVDTRRTVDGGFGIIKDSLSKMDEIRKANAETIEGIKLLGEKIDSIWEIVNIINGIADQTKIIAFNAELEASAAGEAGKNFQIVATEIRRLADNTVSSTNEIRSKINEIQHSSDRLIIASEEGTEKIKQGWELSEGLKRNFDEILRSSEISVKSAEQISVSIKQQVTAFEQILLTLKQISEGIDNFVVSTKSMTASTEGLKNKSTHLNQVIGKYRVGEGGLNG